jgi:hypothetical protein
MAFSFCVDQHIQRLFMALSVRYFVFGGDAQSPQPTSCDVSMDQHADWYEARFGRSQHGFFLYNMRFKVTVTILSKFSTSLADIHYPYLKGFAQYLRKTIHRSIISQVTPKVDHLVVAGGLTRVVRILELRIHSQSVSATKEIALAVFIAVLCIA